MKMRTKERLDADWSANLLDEVLDLKGIGYDSDAAIQLAVWIVDARMELEPYCGRKAALDTVVNLVKMKSGNVRISVDVDLLLVPSHLLPKIKNHPKVRNYH
jgi:hypothetical protein